MTFFRTLSAVALVMGTAGVAAAQTATQTVAYSVTDVNTVAVSASPAAMSAPAGGIDATNSATTYSVTTNSTTAKKITGLINTVMLTGVTLSVSLADPDGAGAAVSTGPVLLIGSALDLVTGITQLSSSENVISYVLHAGVTAAAEAGSSRTVTFTIQ